MAPSSHDHVSIKLFLNGNEQIRRFEVSSVDLSFHQFVLQCRSLLSLSHSLPHEAVKVRYKDDEGDLVDITQDEELSRLLRAHCKERSSSSHALHLHVTTTQAQCLDDSGNFHRPNCPAKENCFFDDSVDRLMPSVSGPCTCSVVHEGVACNVCHYVPLTGNRYKCLECLDFDLCQTCFLRNNHRDHDMVVLRRDGGLGHLLCSKFTRRVPVGTTPFAGTAAGIKRAAVNGSHDLLSTFDPTNSSSFQLLDEQGDMVDLQGRGFSSNMSNNSNSNSKDFHAFDSMGKLITELLQERGLSVSYSVENSPHNSNSLSESGESISKLARAAYKAEMTGGGSQSQTSSRGQQSTTEVKPSASGSVANDRAKIDSCNDLSHLSRRIETGCSITGNPPTGVVPPSSSSASQHPYSGPGCIDESGFTFIDTRESFTPAANIMQPPAFINAAGGSLSATSTAATTPLYPSTLLHSTPVQQRSIPVCLPDHVANSRLHMLNMGFTDENNWLSQLLLAHNGDISKCLDDIQRRTGST